MRDATRALQLIHESAALAERLSDRALATADPGEQRRLFAAWGRAQDRYLRRCFRAMGRRSAPPAPAPALLPPHAPVARQARARRAGGAATGRLVPSGVAFV
jgi:hypothetical protein